MVPGKSGRQQGQKKHFVGAEGFYQQAKNRTGELQQRIKKA
jgi:hypothetical protein